MTAVTILIAAALVVVAAIAYTYLPSRKIKPWLCSILWKVALLPHKVERVAAAMEEPNKGRLVAGRTELEKVFSTFDKNGDGFITVAELEDSLRKLGLPTTSEEVAHMVERLDTNGDGLLDLDEFWELYKSVGGVAATEEEEPEGSDGDGRSIRIESVGEAEAYDRDLKEAFDVFDGNGDGLITVEELGMVLAALGLAPGAANTARCREMISKVDTDGDGMVSFEEFKRMMRRGANHTHLF